MKDTNNLQTLAKRTKIKYIDLRLDYAFKLIFGTHGNEDMLLLLVQSILPHRNITSVELNNKENVGLRPDSRRSVFDISCTTSTGTILNIEMQYKAQDDFNNRMLFYSTFPIYNSVAPGSTDTNTFDPEPLCMIGITNYILRRIKENEYFINSYHIKNDNDSGIVFTDSVSYITVELPKFNKKLSELSTDAERLFYVIKHIGSMKSMPKEFEGTKLEKMFRICNFAAMESDLQMEYIREWMAQVDERSRLRTAVAEGEARGEARGEALGEARARESIARKLKELGIQAEAIAEASGLSVEEVAAL